MFGLSYWFLPAFAGLVWLGTLAGMLGWWRAQGSPHLVSMSPNQHVAFISDIGATHLLYPLFIAGSTACVVIFDIAFIAERWLRHKQRLTPNYSRKEAWLSVCAIFWAIVGACGLIFLSIFNTREYPTTHDSLLVVFIVGYIISAIFICAEYQRLGIHYREHRSLRASFWIKLAFIFVEIALAVAFGVCTYHGKPNVAGVLEWTVSLIFIFYVWSFILDFLPATRTKRKENRFGPPMRKVDDSNPQRTEANGNMRGGPVYTSGGDAENQQHMNGDERYYTPNTSRHF